jgi:hypothetical protein
MAATANGSFPDLPDTDTSSEMGDWPTLNEQDREARDVMIHDIRSLYDGGVPLYTKDQIRQMAHQFDRYVAGELEDDTAVLVGINGVEVTQLIFDPTRDGSTEKYVMDRISKALTLSPGWPSNMLTCLWTGESPSSDINQFRV